MLVPKLPKLNRHRNKSGIQYSDFCGLHCRRVVGFPKRMGSSGLRAYVCKGKTSLQLRISSGNLTALNQEVDFHFRCLHLPRLVAVQQWRPHSTNVRTGANKKQHDCNQALEVEQGRLFVGSNSRSVNNITENAIHLKSIMSTIVVMQMKWRIRRSHHFCPSFEHKGSF